MRKLLSLLIVISSSIGFSQEMKPSDMVIEGIECLGNVKTNCEILKSEIYLNPGDFLNEEEISNARIRLLGRGLFKTVDLSLKKGSKKGRVIIVVDVTEANSIFTQATLSHSYNSRTYSFLDLIIGTRNLGGNGQSLSFQYFNSLTDPSDSEQISFIEPHLFGLKKYYAKAFLYHNYHPIDSGNSFNRERYEGGLILGYRIFDFSSIELNFSQSSNLYLERLNLEPFKEKNKIEKKYSVSYGWDTYDDNYFPTEGSQFRVSLNQNYFYSYFRDHESTSVNLHHNNLWSLFGNNLVSSNFSALSSSEGFNYQEIGVNWIYQLKNNYESKVSNFKFNFGPSLSRNEFHEISFLGTYINLNAGMSLDTERFGLLKFNITYEIPK